MGKPIDILGRVFGKWTVVAKANPKPGYENLQFWVCRCECGTEQIRRGSQLLYAHRKGVNQCCSVCSGTKHGEFREPEYRCWRGMIDRCERPSHRFFHHYGGRGISVCERWRTYDNFLSDMGRRPSDKHSLDRIDNNGNYEPNNCRWTTSVTQLRNRRANRIITFNGKAMCVAEWSDKTGISSAAITQRIDNLGWSIEDALTIPAEKACNWRGTKHKDAQTITYNGETLSHNEWEKRLGVSKDVIRDRLARGWTIERALTTFNTKAIKP